MKRGEDHFYGKTGIVLICRNKKESPENGGIFAEILSSLRDVLEPLDYCPSIYKVEMWVSGDAREAEEELHFKEEKIREVLGDNVYGVDGDTLRQSGQDSEGEKAHARHGQVLHWRLVGNLITDVPEEL